MPSSGYRKQTMDFSEMSRDLQNAAASFTKMSAAAAGFVSLVGAFKTFELEVTKANAAIGGSAKTYKQLSDAARNFALVSKYSAGEAAGSMVMLAQAGFDAQETMAAMPHVLQLAQASMENLDLVADTVASTIRTFNMSADEASRVTNVFAASCVNSLATVNKLAFSFRQVGPVAAELGMNIEQTAAALDVLYNRGLRGEQAGTALRNILIRLIKPTKDTQEAFSNLGIGLKNADGSARDLQAILGDLRKANINDTYLAKIFGREALAASKTLIAATAGEYEKMKDSITDTNTVARMANAQLNTLDGALKLIKNSLSEVGIILGQTITPVVKTVASYIQDLAIALRTADDSTISTIKNLVMFVSVLGTGKFALMKVVDLFSKLTTAMNNTAAWFSKTSRSVSTFVESMASSRLQMLRLQEIAANNKQWNDAYNAMNEYYRAMNNGANLAVPAAAKIWKLNAATTAWNKTLAITGTLFNTLKAAVVSFGKVAAKYLVVLAAMTVAFKAFDAFMQARERKKQRMNDLFPEIEYLDQKIKDLKTTVTNDLPAVAKKYKDIMDQIEMVNKAQERTNISGVAYSEGNILPSKDFEASIKTFSGLIKNMLHTEGTIDKDKAYTYGKNLGLDYDVIDTILRGVDDSIAKYNAKMKDISTQVTNTKGGLLVGLATVLSSPANIAAISNTPTDAKGGMEALDNLLEANAASAKKLNDDRLKLLDEAKKTASDFARELANLSSSSSWLFKNKSVNEDSVKRVREALARFLGIPTDKKEFDAAVRENVDILQEALQKYEGDTTKIVNDFVKSDIFANLSKTDKEAVVSGKAEMEVEAKVTPLNLSQQESSLATLRKSVADMVSDYKITWELLSTEQVAAEKLKGIEQQYSVNRLNTLKEQKDLIQKIFDLTGNNAFSLKALEGTLDNVNKTTGEWLEKERLLAIANQNKDPEVRKMVSYYIEMVDLKIRELAQQNKLLDKDKERLTVIEGHYKYQKEYTAELERQIAFLDKQATIGTDYGKNFENGLQAGLLEVQKEIDSVYDMAKSGMKGFADYMSDSMYDIVENWDKGWKSMKDALRNTLIEMLKDMAKYFAKMAAYNAVMAMFGGFMQNARAAYVNETWAGHDANAYGPWIQAKGGAWQNGLQTFAKGGVVTQPTLFNHKTGKGLMGEAGPEAIVPLKRDKDGNLGISMNGNAGNSYSSTIVINAQTGTAQVKSDTNYSALAKRLDEQIRGVVLSTLVREKKPGGILA